MSHMAVPVDPATYPWLSWRSERSYSGLESVGCAFTGLRSGDTVTGSLAFADSLTAAAFCVRELLSVVPRAQPVPRATSPTKALRLTICRALFMTLSSPRNSGSPLWALPSLPMATFHRIPDARPRSIVYQSFRGGCEIWREVSCLCSVRELLKRLDLRSRMCV